MWFPICCFIGLRRAYTDWLALMAFDGRVVPRDQEGHHRSRWESRDSAALRQERSGTILLGPYAGPDMSVAEQSSSRGTADWHRHQCKRQWVALERTTAGAKIAMKRPEATQTTKEGGVPRSLIGPAQIGLANGCLCLCQLQYVLQFATQPNCLDWFGVVCGSPIQNNVCVLGYAPPKTYCSISWDLWNWVQKNGFEIRTNPHPSPPSPPSPSSPNPPPQYPNLTQI